MRRFLTTIVALIALAVALAPPVSASPGNIKVKFTVAPVPVLVSHSTIDVFSNLSKTFVIKTADLVVNVNAIAHGPAANGDLITTMNKASPGERATNFTNGANHFVGSITGKAPNYSGAGRYDSISNSMIMKTSTIAGSATNAERWRRHDADGHIMVNGRNTANGDGSGIAMIAPNDKATGDDATANSVNSTRAEPTACNTVNASG